MMLEEAHQQREGPWGGGDAVVKFVGVAGARAVGQACAMGAKEDREKRLAAALRDNLKRRKAAGTPSPEPSAQPAERDGDGQEERDQR